jgi:hypothetical protein
VTVAADGSYTVVERRGDAEGLSHEQAVVSEGVLGMGVSSNYIAGAVEFGPRGWPLAAGWATPRAGTYAVGEHRVVLQLGGCIRCL